MDEDSKMFGMQIRRIKQLSFFVNEALYKLNKAENSEIKLDYRLGFITENDIVDFTLKISFFYSTSKTIYLESEIQNIFQIKDLKNFVDETGKMKLPDNALISMVSLSISHARAITANNVAGTLLNDIILPIFDGVLVAKQFFGNINSQINTSIQPSL